MTVSWMIDKVGVPENDSIGSGTIGLYTLAARVTCSQE